MKTNITDIKIVKDSNEEYHSSKAISASGLKVIEENEGNLVYLLNKEPMSSPFIDLGSAVHGAILEPEIYDDEFFVMPKIDRRTKSGKEEYLEYQKKSEGKTLLTEDQGEIVNNIMKYYNKNDLAKFYSKGDIEVSHYLTHEGVDVRVRPDIINKKEGFIADIKTCQKNSPRAFRNDIYKRFYHLQATFYCDMLGYDPAKFRFIACNTNKPYTVEVYGLSEDLIERGREAWKNAFYDYKFYLNTGIITGYRNSNRDEDGTIIL